jgi:hypothetical protein
VDSWDTFAPIACGAPGALLGLLFVAISIRIGVIAGSRGLRSRAAQTLVLFGMVLLVSLLLAIPGQSDLILGIEVIALAGVGCICLTGCRRIPQSAAHRPSTRIISPNTITTALLQVSVWQSGAAFTSAWWQAHVAGRILMPQTG